MEALMPDAKQTEKVFHDLILTKDTDEKVRKYLMFTGTTLDQFVERLILKEFNGR